MKKFYILALIVTITGLLFTSAASAQVTDDYRTVASGNWNSLATWERYSGTTWQALTGTAPLTLPTSGDNVITIRNGHTVTVTAAVTVDQVTIDAGGQVTVNNVTLTINDGTGNDLNVNGTLEVTGASGTVASTGGPAFAFNSGSIYRHSKNGGSIVVATGGGSGTTWNTNSTIDFSAGGTLSASTNNATIGKISVSNNSNATITGGALTVSNGTGTDLSIASGSSLTIGTGADITLANTAGLTADISGTLTITAGRTFNHGTSTSVTTVTGTIVNAGAISNATAARLSFSGGTYQHSQNGGTIPTATWNTSSTCLVTGTTNTAPGGLGQAFGNFTWNCTGQTGQLSFAGALDDINGNFSLQSTGTGEIRFANSTGGAGTTINVEIDGNFSISGGTLVIIETTGIINVNVRGNFSMSGGTLDRGNGNDGNFNFAGTSTQTFSKTAGTITGAVDFAINSGATVDFGTSVLNGTTATFNLNSGGAIITANTGGLSSSGATGSIQVGGTRTYNTGASYTYNGSAAQVTGNGVPATVANLTINNTSGGVTLTQATTVSGVATFTNGILTTTTPNLLTISSTGSTTGASDASFVDGPVAKAGTGNFVFPVGKTGVGYMQIDISGLTNAAAGTVFTAQYFRASARTTFGVTGLPGLGLQGVSNCEYWTLDRTTDVNNDATASITMYWNSHSPCNGNTYVANPPLGLKIVHFNTGTNQWDAIGGGAITGGSVAGYLTWPNVSNFSPFALGALAGSQSSLPVMYDNVKAYGKGTGVQIEWSNLTERELIKYEVERSLNGSDFTAISSHLPKSNRNDKADYTDFDAAPAQGTNYYRIKAYETGGKIIYSKILRVEIGNSTQARFSVYPNPVTGSQVTVGLNNLKQGKYTVRIVNAAGQDVQKQTINVQSSSMTQTLQLSAAAKSGMYTMLISGDNFKESKVFIIK